MDSSMQELIALAIVIVLVAAALFRRFRRGRTGKTGCDGCETGDKQTNGDEKPLKFYKRL
jgi:membrane protein implicated in regulation of membrane protease activity